MTTPVQQKVRPTDEALKALNASFESRQPQDVLAYALGQYEPNIVLACSFGAEDVVLVDMIQKINPHTNLFYLDTDFLFKETHEVRDRRRQLGEHAGAGVAFPQMHTRHRQGRA